MLGVLIDWLRAPEDDSRRALVWLRRVLLPARLPGVEIPEVHDLMEMHSMLAERVVEWTQRWKAEGLQQGLQEGAYNRGKCRRRGRWSSKPWRILERRRTILRPLSNVEDRETLHGLLRQAITCPTLEAFREALHTQS